MYMLILYTNKTNISKPFAPWNPEVFAPRPVRSHLPAGGRPGAAAAPRGWTPGWTVGATEAGLWVAQLQRLKSWSS